MTAIGYYAFSDSALLQYVDFLGSVPTVSDYGDDYPDYFPFYGVAPGARANIYQGNIASFGEVGSNWKGLVVALNTEEGTPPASVDVVAAARQAATAAAAQREAERKSARSEISNKFKGSEKVTIETFRQADIPGITAENIAEVQEEILALPDQMRGDIAQVLKVARKYEVVGIIASDRVSTVYSNSLVEVGLIPQERADTSFLTYLVRKLPESERTNYAQIKAVIDSQMIKMQQRQDRLAAVKARIAAARAA